MLVESGLQHGPAILGLTVTGKGHELDFGTALLLTDPAGDLVSVEPWQTDIDQRHIGTNGDNCFQSARAIRGNFDRKSIQFQQGTEHFATVGIVFHEHDPRGGAAWDGWLCRRIIQRFRGERQPNRELATLSEPVTVGRYRTGVHLDQGFHQREPHPHSSIAAVERVVGLKEHVEDLVQHDRFHAATGVPHA